MAWLPAALERYKSHYLSLAATVPEFMVWAMLGEHAATRSAIAGLRANMSAALDANRDALGRMERLLALNGMAADNQGDLCLAVAPANQGVLGKPIIPVDAERYGTDIVIPSVEQIHVNPRYKIAVAHNARAADEKWWDRRPSLDDFDLMLAGHVMAPDATRIPLLPLGHPGAGKSLLTKVLAARLPTAAYTVVRVPLRRVGANAPIWNQIQQALALDQAAGPSSASARSATWVAPEPSGADLSTPLEPRSLVEGDENDGRGTREAQKAPA